MQLSTHAYYVLFRLTHIRLRRRVRLQFLALAAAGFLTFGTLVYSLAYLLPTERTLSYGTANCIAKTTFLPGLHKLESPKSTPASFRDTKSFRGYPVMSSSICLDINQAPQENKTLVVSIKPFGNPLVRQTTRFSTGTLPKLSQKAKTTLSGTISTQDPLQFSLDKSDKVFTYQLAAPERAVTCSRQVRVISCDVRQLALGQGQKYQLSLIRLFESKPVKTMLTSAVETVTPINVVATSIGQGAHVYDTPANIIVQFDKPLATFKDINLTANGQPKKFTAVKQGPQLIITFAEPLARAAAYELTIGDVRATDKGFLVAPYKLTFTTSGGPKLTGKNIGNYDVAFSTAIRLTFDVALRPDTAAQYIQLHGTGGQIASAISTSGNTVTITPGRSFNRCETFYVKVLDGISSVYGITGGSATQLASRTTCRTTYSIGLSAQGRSIIAHKFGSGASTILYVGGTHGNELSSKYILDSWLNHLESVYPSIPAHRSIVVIPSVNPDGIARGTRNNARGVDLNRNFPANNWKSDVTNPDGVMVTGGGGSSALSEPESSALATYTQLISPRLVLTYHSKGSIVTANDSGDSMVLANIYSNKTGYWALSESLAHTVFQYDTTGGYENWLHDKIGIPALLIELPGHSGNYFNANSGAMWHMVKL